jgi:DNA-binding transcriptional MerR regulator
MGYRIGDVAKFLNIPVETIRFYESKNIVNPRREKDNEYRIYDTWDVFWLGECLFYKSFNLTLKEVTQHLREGSLKSILETIYEKKTKLQDRIQFETLLAEKMEQFIQKYETVPFNVGKYWIKKMPESIYIDFVESIGDNYGDIDINHSLFFQWSKYFPFVTSFLHCATQDLRDHSNKFKWSLKIDKRYAEILKLPLNKTVITVPEHICIATFIDIGEKGELSSKKLEPILSYAEQNSYKTSNEIFGEGILRIHENGNFHRFIEFLLPIHT